jgi:two-component system sensor histidine kinase BarA
MMKYMTANTLTRKHYLVISLLVLLCSMGLCLIIYRLVENMGLDQEQLHVFRYQLISIALIISLLGSGAYYFYSRKGLSTTRALSMPKPAPSIPAVTTSTLRILAVDDTPANLLMVQNYLTAQGIPVIVASSGAEALDIFQRQPLDMILMDIEMAEMNGIETTQAIRALETSRTPIIAVSAHDESHKRLEVLSQGFDDYIAKPINEKTLFASVQRWCHISITPHKLNKTEEPTPTISITKAAIIATPADSIIKVVDTKMSLKHSNQDTSLAKDMLDLLIQMIKDERNNLRLHHEHEEWEALYQLNHKIYGGSSYCGVPALQQANQSLEKLLQQKLSFGGEDTNENTNNNILMGFDEEKQARHIEKAISALLTAIDNLIHWDSEYDTSIVFNVE